MNNCVTALALLAGIFLTHPAFAQEPYPKRTNIEMTVLFPAGSSADVTARLLSLGMSKQLAANVAMTIRCRLVQW